MSSRIELSEVITDIAAGPFGSNLKVACFVEKGFPIIDGANLKGYKVTDNLSKFVTEEKARSLPRSIAKRGDVVVTISGTLGQIAYIPFNSAYPEYLCSQRQFRVTFDMNRVYVPYLVFYFHTREGQAKILSFANQTGVPALAQPTKNFKRIELNLPDIATQKMIARYGELLLDKIELNQQINDYLFETAVTLFNKATNDSPMTIPFGEIAALEDGKRIPLNKMDREKRKGPYRYYGAASIMDYVDDYLFDGIRLLIGEDGTVVDSSGLPILQYVWGKYWVNNHAHVARGIGGYSTEAIYLAMSQTAVAEIVTGAVQPKINQKNLNSLMLSLPSLDNLPDLSGLFELIRVNEDESKRLEALRDSLLPKLMAGEIDVSQVDLTPLNNHLSE